MTKYVVVTVGDTVIEVEAPEEIFVPVHEPVYHHQAPPVPSTPPFIVRVDASPGQIAIGEAVTDVAADEGMFTVIFTVTQVVVLQNPTALT